MYIAFFCHCTETKYFIDGWCVWRPVASKEIGGDYGNLGVSTRKKEKRLIMALGMKNRLQNLCRPGSNFS